MPDREKVVERLEKVSYYFKSLLAVGWQGDADIYREHRESVNMAIALLKEQSGWISVKNRMPDKDGKYLCVWQGRSIDTGMFTNGHFRLYGEVKDKLVSHWMPLPELPKEEKHDP